MIVRIANVNGKAFEYIENGDAHFPYHAFAVEKNNFKKIGAFESHGELMEAVCHEIEKNLNDEEVERLWCEFTNVNIDILKDELIGDFMFWSFGTSRDIVWKWFDKVHSKGVWYLLQEITQSNFDIDDYMKDERI